MVHGEDLYSIMKTGKHGICLGQEKAGVYWTQSSPEKQVKIDLGR